MRDPVIKIRHNAKEQIFLHKNKIKLNHLTFDTMLALSFKPRLPTAIGYRPGTLNAVLPGGEEERRPGPTAFFSLSPCWKACAYEQDRLSYVELPLVEVLSA